MFLIYGVHPTPDNRLVVHYEPDHLVSYPENTLRDPVRHQMQIGPAIVDDFTSDPDPMRIGDVQARERMVQAFHRLRFPHKPNRFNQMNGITTMTDAEGQVSVSMNCPYPLRPSVESPVRADGTLPVPFNDDQTTRIFYAAYLRQMGFGPDFIVNALAFQPTPATEVENGVYDADMRGRIVAGLHKIPAVDPFFTFNPQTYKETWMPPEGVTATPEEVYRTIMTTAHFQPDGNIAFDIIPPKPPQQNPVPALPQ